MDVRFFDMRITAGCRELQIIQYKRHISFSFAQYLRLDMKEMLNANGLASYLGTDGGEQGLVAVVRICIPYDCGVETKAL